MHRVEKMKISGFYIYRKALSHANICMHTESYNLLFFCNGKIAFKFIFLTAYLNQLKDDRVYVF